jgi:hypothetical protein
MLASTLLKDGALRVIDYRAAGASPRQFRRAARGDRKILQDRLAVCSVV